MSAARLRSYSSSSSPPRERREVAPARAACSLRRSARAVSCSWPSSSGTGTMRSSTLPSSMTATSRAAPGAQVHELGVAQPGQRALRTGDDRDVADGGGENGGGKPQPVVVAARGLVELVLDCALLGDADGLLQHELLDVEAVADVRWDTPRRGVGMGDEAVLFETGELVAHGRGREVEVVAVDERPRADGRGRVDVLVDDEIEDACSALAEHVTSVRRLHVRRCCISTLMRRVLTAKIVSAERRPGQRGRAPTQPGVAAAARICEAT